MLETREIQRGECVDWVLVNQSGTQWHIVQQEGSCLRLHLIHIAGLQGYAPLEEEIENEIVVEQVGAHCTTELYGVAYLQGQQSVRTITRVRHLVGEGSSRQVFKYVLDGASQGEYLGELKIAPNAQRTSAFQSNKNLLLSSQATMRTRPQLEIYADDVKASHGASTGQLDESALFYMRQRGIGLDQARQLLITAFLKDVIATIQDAALRESLLNAIDGEMQDSQ